MKFSSHAFFVMHILLRALFSVIYQPDNARSCMGSDAGADVIDEDMGKPKFFYQISHILCILQAVPVDDRSQPVFPVGGKIQGSFHPGYQSFQGFFASSDRAVGF